MGGGVFRKKNTHSFAPTALRWRRPWFPQPAAITTDSSLSLEQRDGHHCSFQLSHSEPQPLSAPVAIWLVELTSFPQKRKQATAGCRSFPARNGRCRRMEVIRRRQRPAGWPALDTGPAGGPRSTLCGRGAGVLALPVCQRPRPVGPP